MTSFFREGIDDVVADFKKIVQRLDTVKQRHMDKHNELTKQEAQIAVDKRNLSAQIDRADGLIKNWKQLV